MKLLSYRERENGETRWGFLHGGLAVDAQRAAAWMKQAKGRGEFADWPASLRLALADWPANLEKLRDMDAVLASEDAAALGLGLPLEKLALLPPVSDPSTFRDFYSFEQHVKASRKQRGLEMHPDWYRIPIFYFSNPNALYGHAAPIPYPEGTKELDFELEISAVVARGGRDISREKAGEFIAGYTICNDWSARDWQREEMVMNLGPAKGKDFATSFGPVLVTADEFADVTDGEGRLNLGMRGFLNGKQLAEANASGMYHPFPALLERASRNANLMPGDYIASGTCGTGCILELRPENTGGWLKKGDIIKFEIDRIGTLENRIV